MSRHLHSKANTCPPFSANYNSYHTGTEAFSAFQADAGLTAKYMAVSGSVSVGASINKMFSTEYSYAFFTYNANLINVFFKNWADYVAEKGLKKRLQNLGKFDASYPDLAVIRRWKSFFKAFGTHVITSCTYGARFQLVSVQSQDTNRLTSSVFIERMGFQHGFISKREIQCQHQCRI